MGTEWTEAHRDCPFCGGRDLYVARGFQVHCRICGAEGPETSTSQKAWQLWDERTTRHERLRQLVEEAKQLLESRRADLAHYDKTK